MAEEYSNAIVKISSFTDNYDYNLNNEEFSKECYEYFEQNKTLHIKLVKKYVYKFKTEYDIKELMSYYTKISVTKFLFETHVCCEEHVEVEIEIVEDF